MHHLSGCGPSLSLFGQGTPSHSDTGLQQMLQGSRGFIHCLEESLWYLSGILNFLGNWAGAYVVWKLRKVGCKHGSWQIQKQNT